MTLHEIIIIESYLRQRPVEDAFKSPGEFHPARKCFTAFLWHACSTIKIQNILLLLNIMMIHKKSVILWVYYFLLFDVSYSFLISQLDELKKLFIAIKPATESIFVSHDLSTFERIFRWCENSLCRDAIDISAIKGFPSASTTFIERGFLLPNLMN